MKKQTTYLKLFFLLLFAISSNTLFSQIDSVENYFPTNVGTTWVYKIYPQFSNVRERVTITKDSVSAITKSHYIFLNDAIRPEYWVDTMGNVYTNRYSGDTLLIFKQHAKILEAWAGADSTMMMFRIKEMGVGFIFGRWRKIIGVEWGTKTDPDTFSFSPITQYYGEGIGLYFAIVEPSATERILIGFISGKDTLGDITKVINIQKHLPETFVLYQNYPNPFNSSTVILYELKTSQFVTAKIFDVLGREVKELIKELQPSGKHSLRFNAAELQTGTYWLRFTVDGATLTKKLLYLK